jgi:hypothetical protein
VKRFFLVIAAGVFVACMPAPLQGTRRGELHVSIEGDSAAPALNATFDVGSVTVGSTKQIIVRATNVGIDALTVSGASLGSAGNGSWFVRSSSTSVQLAPGASTTATVTFAPASAGPQSTQVTFSHDADAALPSVQLSGTGS